MERGVLSCKCAEMEQCRETARYKHVKFTFFLPQIKNNFLINFELYSSTYLAENKDIRTKFNVTMVTFLFLNPLLSWSWTSSAAFLYPPFSQGSLKPP
jgi:hypothetical protein